MSTDLRRLPDDVAEKLRAEIETLERAQAKARAGGAIICRVVIMANGDIRLELTL